MVTLLLAVGLWLWTGSGESLADTATSGALAVSDTSLGVSDSSGEVSAVSDGSGDAAAVSNGSEDGLAVGVVESADFVAESYARDYSVSVGEAGRRLGRIASLQEAMSSIRALEGSRVAGWGIDHGEDFGAWVWLAGDEGPGVEAARFAAAHGDVEIRTGATHTYEELLAAQDRIDPTLVADDPETSLKIAAMVVYTGIDMAANSVKIAIDPHPGSGRSRRDATPEQELDSEGFAAEAALLGNALQEHTGVGVTVTDASGFDKTANYRAGQNMTTCTAGFAAKQTGGPYGLLTAGHCDNHQEMYGEVLPFVVGRDGTRADAQFHQLPLNGSHQLSNDYVCGAKADSVCEVKGTQKRTDMMGAYVCYTGTVTGVSCGTVTDISISFSEWAKSYATSCEEGRLLDWCLWLAKYSERLCQDDDGNWTVCESVFVEAHGPNLKACHGDSGGPFYDTDGLAYGLLTGSNSAGDCYFEGARLVLSAIDEIEAFLDVKVLTSPPQRPGVPQDLQGQLNINAKTGIELTWTAPVGEVFAYRVYRRFSGPERDYELVATTKNTSYLDPSSELTAGFRYDYMVRAITTSNLESQPSSEIQVASFAIEDLSAEVSLQSSRRRSGVRLSWKIPSPSKDQNIRRFRIYRRALGSGQGYKQIGRSACCDYRDPISGLRTGVEYLYRIRPISWNYDVGSWGSSSDYVAARIPSAKPSARVANPGTIYNGRQFRGVVVSWNVVETDVASYEVYRRAAVAGHPYVRIAIVSETEYYDPEAGLTSGVEYYYRIKTVSSDGAVGHWGSRSNYAAVRLPAVTGLQASVSSDAGSVTFTWTEPTGDVADYEVYRRVAIRGQAYTKIGESTTASYSDPSTGLIPGAEYYYRVRAVSAADAVGSWGTGKNYARVVAPAVGGLRAVRASGGVSVSWEQSSGDVARYKVYRRVAVQGQAYAEIAEPTAAPYLDRSAGLTPGTEYYYRVKPVGASGVVGGWGPGPNYASIRYR